MGGNKVKVGDKVTRFIAEEISMELTITEITPLLIICGPWAFDRATGIEEDEDLEWGTRFGRSGSRLLLKEVPS
jgi:hypothetical protein